MTGKLVITRYKGICLYRTVMYGKEFRHVTDGNTTGWSSTYPLPADYPELDGSFVAGISPFMRDQLAVDLLDIQHIGNTA